MNYNRCNTNRFTSEKQRDTHTYTYLTDFRVESHRKWPKILCKTIRFHAVRLLALLCAQKYYWWLFCGCRFHHTFVLIFAFILRSSFILYRPHFSLSLSLLFVFEMPFFIHQLFTRLRWFSTEFGWELLLWCARCEQLCVVVLGRCLVCYYLFVATVTWWLVWVQTFSSTSSTKYFSFQVFLSRCFCPTSIMQFKLEHIKRGRIVVHIRAPKFSFPLQLPRSQFELLSFHFIHVYTVYRIVTINILPASRREVLAVYVFFYTWNRGIASVYWAC